MCFSETILLTYCVLIKLSKALKLIVLHAFCALCTMYSIYTLPNLYGTKYGLKYSDFFKKFFVGPKFILWGDWLPLFWTLCDPSHGFQSQGGSLVCTLTCSLLNIPHASSRGQATVDASLGSSEIRTRDLVLSVRQANALSTRPCNWQHNAVGNVWLKFF